ncbi:unnamed protein product, partial [Citrullus colocynthis]
HTSFQDGEVGRPVGVKENRSLERHASIRRGLSMSSVRELDAQPMCMCEGARHPARQCVCKDTHTVSLEVNVPVSVRELSASVVSVCA